ncbi:MULTISPECIES: protocatechuate 4,5-dioxygenase subunit alpha [unclassified Sphingomonas]|uniref:protocatechuate 4,5-dioxygenase subunit alpha n=1 Tax=unclassified Sphingomonas TaxID=196159 RepID=UPI0006F39216|nr:MULTISPECIES: protocatechuate 4,5-dioxygenase subunit alpha [unclassified Sphingomonas]KRB78769.1 protocatechuate 3,4-dioxygenase [Sphingomonas sp. Root710]KRB93679.1 protocatechuate 3,4-dioxygenase [Sphingomonas sp. Root720]
MTSPTDIHAYLAEFDDIPGTRVYTAKRARTGYHLNQFAMSLMKPENRAAFKVDEHAYLDGWKLTPAQRDGVLRRDYNQLLDEGGNIYFLAKLFSTDGLSFLQAVGTMTGMGPERYQAMMVAGGRDPAGVRSLREQAGLDAVADAAAEIANSSIAPEENR